MPLFGGLFGGLWGGLFGPQGAGAPGSGGTGGGLGMGLAGCCCNCTVLFDRFNRDDSTSLGDDWVEESGDWYIEDEVLKVDSASAVLVVSNDIVLVLQTNLQCFTIQAKVAGTKPRLIYSWSNDNLYQFVQLDTAAEEVTICNYTTGTVTVLRTIPCTGLISGDTVFKVSFDSRQIGNHIGSLFINGTRLANCILPDAASLVIGLGTGSTDCTFDDVRINRISDQLVTKDYDADGTLVVPDDVYEISSAEVWGGGAGGQNGIVGQAGSGGGGGGYAEDRAVDVEPLDELTITYGAGGVAGANGGTSIVSLNATPIATATGGNSATGAGGAGTVGLTLNDGGDGAASVSTTGGGGGGGAGDSASGANAAGATGGQGGALEGSRGGNGGTVGTAGSAGSAVGNNRPVGYGGGGGGGGEGDTLAGAGRGGHARIKYRTMKCPRNARCCWPNLPDVPETMMLDLSFRVTDPMTENCSHLDGTYELTRVINSGIVLTGIESICSEWLYELPTPDAFDDLKYIRLTVGTFEDALDGDIEKCKVFLTLESEVALIRSAYSFVDGVGSSTLPLTVGDFAVSQCDFLSVTAYLP